MQVMASLTCILFILITVDITNSQSPDDTGSDYLARTRLGSIIGKRYNSYKNQGTLYRFLNIPYAKAPVGQMRFAKPQPYGSWASPLNATVAGPVCYQTVTPLSKDFSFSEDCLQLNIFVPNDFSPSRMKSVMVWVHGGGFTTGSGITYDGGFLALKGDVIVVTINYRLGIFGFLASRDYDTRGNMGLRDQILALNWVRYNIHDYGGNPRDVTIFGESAGALSVSLLALIPNNRGLFHRVIAESGVAGAPGATTNASFSTIRTAQKVGCVHDNSLPNDGAFLQCLRRLDPTELIKATDAFTIELGLQLFSVTPFAPVVDGQLFRREPAVLLQDKSSSEFNFFQSLDFMTGNCESEGSVVVGAFPLIQDQLDFNISLGIPTTDMCSVFLSNMLSDKIKSNDRVFKAVCEKYTVNGDLGEQGRQFLNLVSDYSFISTATSSLADHSNKIQATSTYQYVFFDELSFMLPNAPSWYRGSAHATELTYLFFYEQLKSHAKYPEGAEILVNQMRSYWTNFAKTGNPNGSGLPLWLPFDRNSSHPYMNLKSQETGMGTNYRKPYMDFWLNKIPAMLSECDQTSCALPVVG